MLGRIARLTVAAPRRVIAVVALAMVAIAVFGIPVAKSLSAGGLENPDSESAAARTLLTDKFGAGDVQLLIVVSAPDRFDSPQARAVATDIIDRLQRSGRVAGISSAWTSPRPAAAALVSRDRKAGLIVAGVTGDPESAAGLDQGTGRPGGPRPRPDHRPGRRPAMVNLQITEQSKRDLVFTGRWSCR